VIGPLTGEAPKTASSSWKKNWRENVRVLDRRFHAFISLSPAAYPPPHFVTDNMSKAEELEAQEQQTPQLKFLQKPGDPVSLGRDLFSETPSNVACRREPLPCRCLSL
jgi:hypothetical protein